MTGFSSAQGQENGCSWTWEIKSVNSKGLDVRCRLPSRLDRLEQEVRLRVKARFSRGAVALALTMDGKQPESFMRVNHAALEHIIAQLPEIRRKLPESPPPRIEGLLALRGVMETADGISLEEGAQALDEPLLASLDQALEALAEMRASEGLALAKVLEAQLEKMMKLVDQIAGLAALQPAAVKERLKAQINELLAEVPALSAEKLAQEAALLLIKSDIREELDRLKAHVFAAKSLLKQNGAIGRSLDFLCQEFSREANTLCSKSPDVEMIRLGLDIKSIIDQLREQAQNIE